MAVRMQLHEGPESLAGRWVTVPGTVPATLLVNSRAPMADGHEAVSEYRSSADGSSYVYVRQVMIVEPRQLGASLR